MRTQSFLSPVVFFGTLVLGAVGCQVIGGISGLEVKDTGSTTASSSSSSQGGGGSSASQGGGGASSTASQGGGGASSTASQGGGGAAQTTTTSSGGGMGGMTGAGGAMQGGGGAGGTPECQSDVDCPAATTCTTYQCKNGTCEPNFASDGTSCKGPNDGECAAPTCDGSGNCVQHDAPNGTNCGDGPTDCSDQDTCQAGVCQKNDKPQNTSCGAATCTNDTYVSGSACDGSGTCVPAAGVSCAPYACNASGTACNSTCNVNSDCAMGSFCAGPPNMKAGAVCGSTPADGNPPNNPTCGGGCSGAGGMCAAGGTCTQSCTDATCNANFTPENAVIYTCNGGCNSNTVITCTGGFACTLVCQGNACDDVTLNCGGGPCTVDCKPGASCGHVTQNCGPNSCTATCEGPSQSITQIVNSSCSVTKTACL
jgi:hypothetical protein